MDVTDTPPEREAEGSWARLHRRKVVQWTLLYATGAFGLAQGLAHLVDTYHWPEPVQQVGTLALILGLPIAVVVAWFHGEKGDQRIGRSELVILSVLLALGGGALWWYGSRVEQAAQPPQRTPPRDAPSVAVLPFVNMSSDPEQEYFSDGLSEEILNALARTPGLYVPARTSSFQFKGQAGDVAEFAAMLGVATVLEGSVRRAEGRVRVTAQLINAADGYQLWSQTYDRELKDIFAIQSEIAAAIAEALKLRLTAQQKLAAEVTPPTTNLDAYEAYLLGRHEANKLSWSKAREYFEKAVEMDPRFAEAHAGLSVATVQDRQTYLPSQAAIARQRHHVDEALALAPESAEVLEAAGRVARGKGDFDQALEYFDRSLAANPSNARALLGRQNVLQYLGRPGRYLDATKDAVKRDPLSVEALSAHIAALDQAGQRGETEPFLERLRQIDEAHWQSMQATFAITDGDYPAALRTLLALHDINAEMAYAGFRRVFNVLGLRDELAQVINSQKGHFPDGWPEASFHFSFQEYRQALPLLKDIYTEEQWATGFAIGESAYALGRFEEAAEVFERGWAHKTTWPTYGSGSERLMMSADAARRVGHTEQAKSYRDWAERFIRDRELDHRRQGEQFLAMVSAYDGRDEDAARHLIAAIEQQEAWMTFHHWPLLAELAGRGDVQAAVGKRRAVIDKQRKDVLRMLCGPNPVSTTYRPAPATCAPARDSGGSSEAAHPSAVQGLSDARPAGSNSAPAR